MTLKAVIFDLDGVITDTAEYHYLAWQRLADEEGFPFDRTVNERLRGVSRRESLLTILDGRSLPETRLQEMMARKNRYYVEMLNEITPADLLPGTEELLDELAAVGVLYALASASRNAPNVCQRLGILERFALLADGSSVERPKPAPDLFRFAAAGLNVPPGECLVIEDAAAGIEAALAAGMHALAIGPAGRFDVPTLRNGRFVCLENLEGVRVTGLQKAMQTDQTWIVNENIFDSNQQHHKETVFTLGNGYFATRGSFEEGFPGELATTLAHGIFDDVPIAVTELANLPNWLDATITINSHRFRLDQGQILSFQRQLDLRQGILQRQVRWQAPDGTVVDLLFERFAAQANPHVGALRLLITAVNQSCSVEIQTGINGHVSNYDPGLKVEVLHWHHLDQGVKEQTIWLHSQTRHSHIELGAAAAVTSSGSLPISCQQCPGQPRLVTAEQLDNGQTLQVDKLVSFATGRDPVPDAADVVGRALAALDNRTYDELKTGHLQAWDALWKACDVVIEGDDEAQLATRFSLFQLLVAAPYHDDRVSIGAKTLSGLGYRGHVFWDTETFILPFFIYTLPDVARNMLLYRYHTLPGARRKAAANGYSGAQYAWESAVTGDEVTPTWVPEFGGKGLVRIWTGDIEIHISADIAYAIVQYWQATGDDAFMRDYGAEIVLDTACFWGDRAEREEMAGGGHRYALRDVIGPDEYHDHVDNNVYTNRMVQWHLQTAFYILDRLRDTEPQRAAELERALDLSDERLAHWQDVIDHIIIHHDPETGLMLQFDDFFERKPIDPAVMANADKSMQVILGIEGANESQVIKQADVIMLLCLLRDEYDARTWQTNWDIYMPLTDHRYGSSLGPSFHAWAACEMGRPEEAYEHFMLAARADLRDVRGNAHDGIHAASAGGIWQALVFGFAGLRPKGDSFTLHPRLPARWKRLAFSIQYRNKNYRIEVRSDNTYTILAGDELEIERLETGD
jgi:kojibiose phosphorylase